VQIADTSLKSVPYGTKIAENFGVLPAPNVWRDALNAEAILKKHPNVKNAEK
jgi:hypothetical protein